MSQLLSPLSVTAISTVLHLGLSHSTRAPKPVERHRGDDDDADDDVLAGVGNIRVDAAIVENRHDQAADQRPEDRSLAAA